MIIIELHNSDEARSGGLVAKGKAPAHQMARKLLELGHHRDAVVSVHRGGRPSFLPQPLGWWADHTIHENDNHGPKLAKYVPFDRRDAVGVSQ